MKAEKVQVGGQHYKVYKVQPYILMNTLSGPAAHIAGYLVRTKGADDLEKARHWCDLAIEAGMQGVTVNLMAMPEEFEEEERPVLKTMPAVEWCWRNGLPAEGALAKALLALEEGDFAQVKKCINLLEIDGECEE